MTNSSPSPPVSAALLPSPPSVKCFPMLKNSSHPNWEGHSQPTIKTVAPKIRRSTTKYINLLLAKLVLEKSLSFSFVNSKALKELLNLLASGYKVLSRWTLQRSLHSAFLRNKAAIAKKVSKIAALSLTTDLWTSRSQVPFLGVTAHFVESGELKSMVLDVKMLPFPHNDEAIAIAIKEILTEFDIKKVLCVTTDNARNVVNAIKSLLPSTSSYHGRCMGHVLNICVKACLDCLQPFIAKIREFVVDLHRSPKVRQEFSEFCKRLDFHIPSEIDLQSGDDGDNTEGDNSSQEDGDRSSQELAEDDKLPVIPKGLIPLDVAIRWNSLYRMIKSYHNFGSVIPLFLRSVDKNFLALSPDEESTLNQCLELLKPLFAVTEAISGESYPTMSFLFSCFNSLSRLPLPRDTDETFLSEAKQQMKAKFDTYIPFMYTFPAFVCAILDPRFKTRWFPN
ncbi:hypothetical protein GEMRC1_010922 [Eukaryota sp. GEM-RC1]